MSILLYKVKSFAHKSILFMLPFMAVAVGLLTSCLKDDTEVFSENSSTRLTEYLQKAESVLTSGNGTWLVEIYPASDQSLGGYAFTMRFTADSVYCRTEMADSTEEAGSLWRTTRDDGAVLSLDTYNKIAHMLSTPSASLYQAYYGEFEWVITDVQQDLITLRGKKTGNTIYMRRMTETPEHYISRLAAIKEAFVISGLEGSIGGKYANATIDTDTRQITYTVFDSQDRETATDSARYSSAYCVTPEGIRLYQPLTIDGNKISGMTAVYNATGGIIGMTTNAGDSLTVVYPEGYLTFADYIGDYTLYYYLTLPSSSVKPSGYKKVDVSLVAADNGSKFYLTGLNPKYDLTVTYTKSSGTLQICSQLVLDHTTHLPYVASNGNYIGCIAWYATSATAGYVSYVNTVGMKGKWNTDNTKETEIAFSDNGIWQAGYTVNSFMFYYFNSTTPSDASRVSTVNNSDDYIQGTYKSYTMPYIKTMIKK